MMKKIIFSIIFLLPTLFFVGCSESNDPCAKSWQMLKNPRLDVIADDLANLRAKVSNGQATQSDGLRIQQLQEEENRIWQNATIVCK
jgi:PBP1b-binding outer membrane lipoprotein LpoB